MNLSDQEILELHQLCDAVVDGTLTGAQKSRLSQKLAASEEAREVYVRLMGLSASLYSYASEMQTEALDLVPPKSNVKKVIFAWGFGSLAAAATIALLVWVWGRNTPI